MCICVLLFFPGVAPKVRKENLPCTIFVWLLNNRGHSGVPKESSGAAAAMTPEMTKIPYL
jgi:hypothetical protein